VVHGQNRSLERVAIRLIRITFSTTGVANAQAMSLLESTELRESYPPPLSESYAAVPAAVPKARNAVCRFAAIAGARREQVDALRLAVSEALTNVVMHAYDRTPGRIQVTAWLAADELWVLIADDGAGLHPRVDSPGLGLGLGLIAQLSDGFAIVNRACGGTELRMRFALRAADRSDSDQSRGSVASATSPASPSFSTTT
jgi:anti-sigma regulatory factor (Ser/Thr protein kinase)